MYKLIKDTDVIARSVQKENFFIPFDPNNTDYIEFKRSVLEQEPAGETTSSEDTFSINVEPDYSILEDADGNKMTLEEAKIYVSSLP